MGWNLRKLIPRVTWKQESQEIQELKNDLLGAKFVIDEYDMLNRGLQITIANVMGAAYNLRDELHNLLSAIALQHGGELVVKKEFFDSVSEEGAALSLKAMRNEDGSVTLTLVSSETIPTEEEDFEDDAETLPEEDERNQQ
jgi:hypothetical protein